MDRYQLANAALSAGMGLSANGAPLLMGGASDYRPSRRERHEHAARERKADAGERHVRVRR